MALIFLKHTLIKLNKTFTSLIVKYHATVIKRVPAGHHTSSPAAKSRVIN